MSRSSIRSGVTTNHSDVDRLTSTLTERSIAGQIEFWAQLGRALEPVLKGDTALALRRSGIAKPLSNGPNRLAAVFERGRLGTLKKPVQTWVKPLL